MTTVDTRLAEISQRAVQRYASQHVHDTATDDVRWLLAELRRVTAERDRARWTAAALGRELERLTRPTPLASEEETP